MANNKKESQSQAIHKKVTFAELWGNFPGNHPCKVPDSEWTLFGIEVIGPDDTYDNQCAIQLGVCLQRAGVSLATYTGVFCNYSKGAHKTEKHPIRATEMANWLSKRYLAGFPAAQTVTGQDWISKVKGRKGIIFFKNYWVPEGGKYPTGSHIDLWNGTMLTSTGLWEDIQNCLRFRFNVEQAGVGSFSFSSLNKAEQILFWEFP